MMKKIANKTTDKSGVDFQFVNGKKLVCRLDELPEEIVKRLAVHGLAQKIGDSYAGVQGAVEIACLNANDVWESLKNGDWNVGRSGTGGVIAEAIARVTGRTVEECRDMLAALDDDAKAKLRKQKKVASAMADITAERAKKKADNATEDDMESLTALFH